MHWPKTMVASLLGASRTAADTDFEGGLQPLLEVMYMRFNQEPIDTTPVFDPVVSQYAATLDWKMKYFSVQAQPVAPAVIDNIRLCPQDADCLKQEQPVVTMDFSRNILVQPGGKVLYMFDVLLEGVVKSYTLIVNRLEGSETTLRHILVLGGTVYPHFRPEERSFRCMMPSEFEVAQMELHVLDGGQTVFTISDPPVPLGYRDNITLLRNTGPGEFRSPHTRRMREEAFGEFQYPNKYADFTIPLSTKRLVHIKIVSSDGGHFGHYSLELARGGCLPSAPLFDSVKHRCVRFCNTGFYADHEDSRCKRCHDLCMNCLSLEHCLQCQAPDRQFVYMMDNSTRTCIARHRSPLRQHPQETMAATLTLVCLSIFACGLCAFHRTATADTREEASAFVKRQTAHEELQMAPSRKGGSGRLHGGSLAAGGAGFGRAGGPSVERDGRPDYGGYMPVSGEDY